LPRDAVSRIDEKVGDADDVWLWRCFKVVVGLNPDAVGSMKALFGPRDDVRTHALRARDTPCNESEIASGEENRSNMPNSADAVTSGTARMATASGLTSAMADSTSL
jgi:hypothetical protein